MTEVGLLEMQMAEIIASTCIFTVIAVGLVALVVIARKFLKK